MGGAVMVMKAMPKFLTLLFVSLFFTACAHREVKIVGVDTPQMPLMRVGMLFPFGSADESTGVRGSTALVFEWLLMSTAKGDEELLRAGAIKDIQVEPHFTLVSLEAPEERFLKAWTPFLERLRSPAFDDSFFEATKKKLIATKRSRLFAPLSLFRQFSYAALHSGSLEANCHLGVESEILSLTPDQARSLYQKTFGKGPAVVFVPSAKGEALRPTLEGTKGWAAAFTPSMSQAPSRRGRRIVIVDRPGSRENYLVYIKTPPAPDSLEYFYAMLATEILGGNGANSSILGDTLRRERALTYHASLQTARRAHKPIILGLTFGPNEKIADLAAGYLELWDRFIEEEFTDLERLHLAEKVIEANVLRENESLSDLFKGAVEAYSAVGSSSPPWKSEPISLKRFNEMKAKWLSTSDLTVVAIGDRRVLMNPLIKVFGYRSKLHVVSMNSDWDAVSDVLAGDD